MTDHENRLRNSWDLKAAQWRTQVGEEGDRNRRLNSDPVLWRMLGPVAGLKVLDAGCGTGYLSAKLIKEGATVTAVDFAPAMVALAQTVCVGADCHVDDAQTLKTVADGSQDRVVSNYVLMDLADHAAAARAMARVLKPGGVAVAIFSHPCFPQGRAHTDVQSGSVSYIFHGSYFKPVEQADSPWGPFTSDFIWFHRPLADYVKAFRAAGLTVDEIDEPHLTPDRPTHGFDARVLKNARERPYSIAFRLIRPLA